MVVLDTVNRIFREFKRYTGDGLPGEPAGAPLPVGDPQSGPHSPKKSEIRTAMTELLGVADAGAVRAEAAADAAESALSSIAATSFPTKAAAMAYTPLVGPSFIRLEGYVSPGDGGGALYKKVASQPAHAGKFSITLSVSGAVVWYEIAEFVIDPMMLGAVGFTGTRDQWNTILAAGTYTDDYFAIQAANDILVARSAGGTLRISRWHVANTPITLSYGVSLIGDNRFTCGIFKDSATTRTVTYYDSAAVAQSAIYPGNLPTAANAVLVLGTAFANGRWVGEIKGVTLAGTYAAPGNWSSQKVEFGILSIGSISDFVIDGNNVEDCRYGMLIPTPFVGQISNNRISSCLSGVGIGNCTTMTIHGNYANNCRDYGFAMRAGKYSSFFGNACDYLNWELRHPDRTRECSAYIFNSCIGVNVYNNGQEGSRGNSFYLDTLRYCSITNNQVIRIGSDYSGAADIAVWKMAGAMVGCIVADNNAYEVSENGLVYGAANPAKHHNIFVAAGTLMNATTVTNNVARAVFGGLDAEAGWLNNVVEEVLNVKRGQVSIGMDPVAGRSLTVKGKGSTSGTNSVEVLNAAGASHFRLRDDGVLFSPPVYNQTTAAAANVFIGSDGSMFRSTSAMKYKTRIGDVPEWVVDAVVGIVGFTYRAKNDSVDNETSEFEPGREFIGLSADAFHEAGLHWFVNYGYHGEPEGLMYERVVAVLMQEARSVRQRLDQLERRRDDG